MSKQEFDKGLPIVLSPAAHRVMLFERLQQGRLSKHRSRDLLEL
jgi:hypothetical protein